MQVRILIWIIFIVLFLKCTPPEGYRFYLSGNIAGKDTGQVVLFTPEMTTSATGELKQGKFKLKGEAAEPGNFCLQIGDKKLFLLLDGKKMELVSDYEHLSADSLTGSPENELRLEFERILYEEYESKLMEVYEKYNYFKIMEAKDQVLLDEMMTESMKHDSLRLKLALRFIQKHPDNVYSVYLADKERKFHYEIGIEMYRALSPMMQETAQGQRMKKALEDISESAVGKSFPRVTGINEAGDTVVIFSWTGRVTVIDFWASWCAPCREEMASLKRFYPDWRDKGVEIVSISLDNSLDAWQKACQEEQIPWISLHNPQGFKKTGLVKMLGIRAIPFIVVIDKEGKIVAKGLRRNMLRDKIETLL